MQGPDLENLKTLIVSVLAPDEEVRNQGSLAIQAFLNEKRQDFIISCIQILKQYQTLDLKLLRQTILFLNMAFSPDNNFQMIFQFWYAINNTARDEIKSTCFNLIECTDEIVRDLTSQCISRISIYDRGLFDKAFTNLIQVLSNTLPNKNFTMETRLSALMTIKYFYENRRIFSNKREEIKFNFSDQFKRGFASLLDILIQFLSNIQGLNEKFIVALFETLSEFVLFDKRNQFFAFYDEKTKNESHEKMTLIFKLLFDIAQQNAHNENIFRSIHHLFYSFYKSTYDYGNSNPDCYQLVIEEYNTLFNNYINQINLLAIVPPTNISYIAIDFWNEIGKHEKKILQEITKIKTFKNIVDLHHVNIECNKKSPMLFFVLDHFRDKLLPILLKCMELIDPEKADADSLSKSEFNQNDLHTYAKSVVRKLFYFNPERTAQFIFEYFKETLNQQQVSWNIRQAQMQMIICISKVYNNKPFQPILSFIQSISGMMFQTLTDFKDKNIVLNTTLSAFAITFKYYKLFIGPNPTIQLLNLLCQICNAASSQVVVQRCVEVFKQIVICFDKNDPDSHLDAIFPLAKGIFTTLSNRPDFLNSIFFNDTFKFIETLVQHINPNKNNNLIIELMNFTYQTCKETQNINIFMNELHVFSLIMVDYGEHFIQQGLDISNKVLNMLNGPNQTIIEDCLYCLINIVSGLKMKAEPLLPQLKTQLMAAYNSHSPGIIIQVNRVIGSLFINTGPMMADILTLSVDSIIGQILAARTQSEYSIFFTKQIHFLIFPLAQILKSIPAQEQICLIVREKVFDKFYEVLTTFNTQNNDEKNIFFESMCYAFSAVIEAFAFDINFLKGPNKLKVFKIIDLLSKLESYTDNFLFAYCSYIDSAIKILGNNPLFKAKLKSNAILRYLIWAECSSNPNISFMAQNLINILTNKPTK